MPATLAEMMQKELDPSNQISNAKYENARLAITNGYALAATIIVKDHTIEDYITLARQIAGSYLNDLNETLSIKYGEHNGKPDSQSQPTSIPGPSQRRDS